MGNLQFNSQNVTRRLRVANSTSAWVAQSATPVQIVQSGYLRDLNLLLTGTLTTTTTAITLLDSFAPWGMFGNLQVNSNVQAGIINVSGIGANLIDQVIYGLEQVGNTPDTNVVTPQGGAAVTTLYNAPLTTAGGTLALPYWLPLAQEIKTLDGEVGIWDLQDPSIQMTLVYTPGCPVTTGTTFNVVEGTAATGAGLFTQAANTSVINTTNVLVSRVMYDPPLDEANDPEFGFVNSWYEEMWNTALPGSKQINWRALANSGYITRLVFSVFDSTGPAGVADSNVSSANGINLTVGNNAPVVVEGIAEYRFRASQELGRQLTQGAFYVDFLGRGLTMQNVLDTFTAGNINLQMNFVNALGSTSSGKVLRQMLQALQQ